MSRKVLIAKVLDKLVKEVDNRLTWEIWKTGEIVLLKANIKQSIKCKDVERAVELALQMSKENKVPVVSVKEIKKIQKRWDMNSDCSFTGKDPELCNRNQTCVYCVLEHLLSAVRKQVEVKKK